MVLLCQKGGRESCWTLFVLSRQYTTIPRKTWSLLSKRLIQKNWFHGMFTSKPENGKLGCNKDYSSAKKNTVTRQLKRTVPVLLDFLGNGLKQEQSTLNLFRLGMKRMVHKLNFYWCLALYQHLLSLGKKRDVPDKKTMGGLNHGADHGFRKLFPKRSQKIAADRLWEFHWVWVHKQQWFF